MFILIGSLHTSGQWNEALVCLTSLALHASGSNTSRFSYARQGQEIILNQENFTAQTFR